MSHSQSERWDIKNAEELILISCCYNNLFLMVSLVLPFIVNPTNLPPTRGRG